MIFIQPATLHPAFDLDSLHGDGPQGSPELYDTSGNDIKLRVEPIPSSDTASRNRELRYDVPRDASNNALIGDSWNDEDVITQFHLAMLRFYNVVIDHLRADPASTHIPPQRLFRQAQRMVRWHYQWIIVNAFLPQTIGQERVNDILCHGLRFYRVDDRHADPQYRNSAKDALMPIDFSVATYQFGHSQVRPSLPAELRLHRRFTVPRVRVR